MVSSHGESSIASITEHAFRDVVLLYYSHVSIQDLNQVHVLFHERILLKEININDKFCKCFQFLFNRRFSTYILTETDSGLARSMSENLSLLVLVFIVL